MSALADRVHAFYDLVNQGELDSLEQLTAPSYTNHQLPPELTPDLEGTKIFFAELREGFPDLTFSVQRLVADDEMAATWLRVTGTHLQEFMGIAPSSNQIDVEGAEFMRFRHDKLVEHWGVLDRLTMLYQLEAMTDGVRE